MNSFAKISFIAFVLCLANAAYALSGPFIGYCYPAGGQAGTTFECVVGGQMLWNVDGALISGDGVKIESVKPVKGFPNPEQEQRKYLVKYLEMMASGKPERPKLPEDTTLWPKHPFWDNLDVLSPLELEMVRRDLFIRRNPLQLSPSISQLVIIKVTIDADAEKGVRELRLTSPRQITNPLRFVVGDLPETKEPLFINVNTEIPVPEVKLPCVMNGQIMPGEIDRFNFRMSAGDVCTFTLIGRGLNPYMGDTVPGFFQPVMSVSDQSGKEMAFADDFHFNPDPRLIFKAPSDGVYTLSVRDSIYRGRADFVYRVSAVIGTPLPFGINAPELPIPTVAEDDAKKGKTLEWPTLISGSVSDPGQTDEFVIKGKKGDVLVAEVFARRLGSPLDSKLKILAPDGKVIAENDDKIRLNIGDVAQHADSYVMTELPRDGKYRIILSDMTGSGGQSHRYFLRLDIPRPDFRLYIASSVMFVPNDGAEVMTVAVDRIDGFSGEIELSTPTKSPFVISGVNTVPTGADKAYFALQSTQQPGKKLEPMTFTASAVINGQTVEHPAIPADEVMQAFAYYHLMPTGKFYAAANWTGAGKVRFELDKNSQKVEIAPGQTVQIKCTVRNLPPDARAEFELHEPPPGITLSGVEKETAVKDATPFTINLAAADTVKAGQFNIIIKARVILPAVFDKVKNIPGKESSNPRGVLSGIRLNVTGKNSR